MFVLREPALAKSLRNWRFIRDAWLLSCWPLQLSSSIRSPSRSPSLSVIGPSGRPGLAHIFFHYSLLAWPFGRENTAPQPVTATSSILLPFHRSNASHWCSNDAWSPRSITTVKVKRIPLPIPGNANERSISRNRGECCWEIVRKRLWYV